MPGAGIGQHYRIIARKKVDIPRYIQYLAGWGLARRKYQFANMLPQRLLCEQQVASQQPLEVTPLLEHKFPELVGGDLRFLKISRLMQPQVDGLNLVLNRIKLGQ